MTVCHCPRGRQYVSNQRWSLILCRLCGSFGAHNPGCIPGLENSKDKVQYFMCETCASTELHASTKPLPNASNSLAKSSPEQEKEAKEKTQPLWLYVQKNQMMEVDDLQPSSTSMNVPTPVDSHREQTRVETVQRLQTEDESRIQLHPENESRIQLHPVGLTTSEDSLPLPTTIPIHPNEGDRRPHQDENVQKSEMLVDEEPPVVMAESIQLEMLEFHGSLKCTGTVRVQIDPKDARFHGKSLEEIRRSNHLIEERDIIHRSSHIPILEQFKEVISRYRREL